MSIIQIQILTIILMAVTLLLLNLNIFLQIKLSENLKKLEQLKHNSETDIRDASIR